MTSPKAGRGGRRSGSERLAATQSLREVKFIERENVRAQLCVPVTFNKAVWLSLGYDNLVLIIHTCSLSMDYL